MDITWTGTEDEFSERMAQLPDVLAGTAPDPGHCLELLSLRVGLVLLGCVKEAYARASEGGPDAWGQKWEPLAGSTLASRRVSTTPATMKRLQAAYKKLSPSHKALVNEQARRLHRTLNDPREQRKAIRVLDFQLRGQKITQKQYNARRKLIESGTTMEKAKFQAAGQWAKILRDTGRLLNSLTPMNAGSGDQILRAVPGGVEVGSNVTTDSGINLLTLHTSPQPRKQKADGSGPVLPRRKVLPDNEQDMPQDWMEAVTAEVGVVLSSREFWLAFLGSKAT